MQTDPSAQRSCARAPNLLFTTLVLALATAPVAGADDFREFSSQGLPGSQGVIVRVKHPAGWNKVPTDDPMALAELRGPQGRLTGILQIGRGRRRPDMAALCTPEHARTMLQNLTAREPDARLTDVLFRRVQGRPAYEIRY